MDIYNYLKKGQEKGFEQKPFHELKKDLEELYEYDILFEELEKSSFFKEASQFVDSDDLLHTRILLSEIREKQELNEKLNSLAYNLNLLRAAIVSKDEEKTTKLIKKVMGNEYSGINHVIEELSSMQSKLESLEELHEKILNSDLSLDAKAVLEQNFSKKKRQLKKLHEKQKNIALNLGNIFLELSRKKF